MPPRNARGKKRAMQEALSDAEGSDASSPLTDASVHARPTPAKRSKRAETKVCPVCKEAIPVRLLGKHYDLEMARVDEIVQRIGSTEIIADAEEDEGLASRSRRSTLKPQKKSSASFASTSEMTLEDIDKTLRAVKRHRKQRHAKLREVTRDEEEAQWQDGVEGTVCPVCSQVVRGDADVVDAHVDSCLAHVRIVEEQATGAGGSRQRDLDVDVDIDGEEGVLAGVSFRGTGFDIRDRAQQDIDDDIDVDGEDDAVFGAPQFTESDILAAAGTTLGDAAAGAEAGQEVAGDEMVGTGGEAHEKTLQDLVAEGKLVRRRTEVVAEVKRAMDEVMGVGETEMADRAIDKAREDGDNVALIKALEGKLELMVSTRISSSTSLLCRICLDPYTEPTASTGCWHTCCRECWLRCLGSTKLCPICKRITAATDLRRVYL